MRACIRRCKPDPKSLQIFAFKLLSTISNEVQIPSRLWIMVEQKDEEGRRQGIYHENQANKLLKHIEIEQMRKKQATTREGCHHDQNALDISQLGEDGDF